MGTERHGVEQGEHIARGLEPVCCADKFSALAGLFRTDEVSGVADVGAERVRVLLAACTQAPAHECAMYDAEVLRAGERASAWFDNVANMATLQAEHERLFGLDCCKPGIGHVSACAATHLEGPAAVIRQDVAAVYNDLGFVLDPAQAVSCPCHVSNELEFVAHCLRMSAGGLPTAGDTASDFLSNHLFAWGIVFAAAVTAVAEHPVVRFTGICLEGLLFCEANAAFDRWHGKPARPS